MKVNKVTPSTIHFILNPSNVQNIKTEQQSHIVTKQQLSPFHSKAQSMILIDEPVQVNNPINIQSSFLPGIEKKP